jgi:sensor c-di-GMP phosphodiesterase-like protein
MSASAPGLLPKLQRALRDQRLHMAYQPKVALREGLEKTIAYFDAVLSDKPQPAA